MNIRTLAGLALLTLAIPVTTLAAPAPAPMSVQLHPTSAFKSKAGFMHVMASATVRYAKHDAYITLSTDNLPKPSTLGAKAYVLYATDGGMTDRVGALHGTGNMAGVKGQVMMAKIQDLYVYAMKTPSMKHPMGKPVLSGMVG